MYGPPSCALTGASFPVSVFARAGNAPPPCCGYCLVSLITALMLKAGKLSLQSSDCVLPAPFSRWFSRAVSGLSLCYNECYPVAYAGVVTGRCPLPCGSLTPSLSLYRSDVENRYATLNLASKRLDKCSLAILI